MVFGVPEVKNMPKNEMKTRVYFQNRGDSSIITTLYYDHQVLKDSWEQVVYITESEISVIQEKSNKSNAVQTFATGEFIIFKMPSPNGKTEWTHPGQSGETFVAEYSTIEIDGATKKAVKVTTSQKRKRTGKLIDYFIEGIGRYQRTSEAGAIVEILEDQKYDPHLPK